MRILILSLLALGIFGMWLGNKIDNKVQRYPDLGFNLFVCGFVAVIVTLAGGTLWALIHG